MASNDGDDGFWLLLFLLLLLGIAAYIAFLIAAAVYTFILFASAIMTVFALLAWHGGLSVLGLNVSELHARLFILRGLLGAVGLPAFVFFGSWYWGLSVADWLWPHLGFGGYALCSAGVLFAGLDGGVGLVQDIIEIDAEPPARSLTPPRAALGHRRDEPEREAFASWDDEEELRGR